MVVVAAIIGIIMYEAIKAGLPGITSGELPIWKLEVRSPLRPAASRDGAPIVLRGNAAHRSRGWCVRDNACAPDVCQTSDLPFKPYISGIVKP